MATKFITPLKSLTLQDDKGIWAQFADGVFTTTDGAVVKRLRALPDDYQVTEAKDEPTEPPKE